MTLTLDNSRLRQLIPGVIHEVDGEASLFDKISPWIDSAKSWLESNFIGADFEPATHGIYPLCEKIIAYKAMADAIPSLDLLLSPAGFAVINTEGRAPASKERVERLIQSLSDSADANAAALVDRLCSIDTWRESPVGKWWCATLLHNLDVAYGFRKELSLLDTYRSIRPMAIQFESCAEEDFFGKSVMEMIRHDQFNDLSFAEVCSALREAELKFISNRVSNKTPACHLKHEMWHLLRPIVSQLKYFPDLFSVWSDEMGSNFFPEPFKNNVKGAFFF